MARLSVFSVEDKYRLVLAVISGELSSAEAARRGRASEQSISTWKRQFLAGGKAGLAESGRAGPSQRERQLAEENGQLKAALGEAHVELRVWKSHSKSISKPSAVIRRSSQPSPKPCQLRDAGQAGRRGTVGKER